MSLYRCKACGSPHVVVDTQKEGYSYVKGAIGTIAFGTGGAAAGIGGKTVQVYKCPDCGLTLNKPMTFELKTLIDIGVASVSARDNLMLNGVKVEWDYLLREYKNIEKSSDDNSIEKEVLEEKKVPLKSESTPLANAEELEKGKSLFEAAKSEYEKDCEKWKIEVERIEEIRKTKIIDETNATYLKQKNEIENEKEVAIQIHTKNRDEYITKKNEAEQLYQTLGILKLQEKKNTKKEIERLTQAIQEETSALSCCETAYINKINSLESDRNKLKKSISEKVKKENPFPLKPLKPSVMIRYNANGEKNSAEDYVMYQYQTDIFRFVEENGVATYSTIKNDCDAASELPDKKLEKVMQNLVSDNDLTVFNGKYSVKYSKSKAKMEAIVKSIFTSPEELKVFEVLTEHLGEKFTVSEIVEKANLPKTGYNQFVSGCIRQLLTEGIVDRVEDNGKAYFKISE